MFCISSGVVFIIVPSSNLIDELNTILFIISSVHTLSVYKWVKYPKVNELYLKVGYLFINNFILGIFVGVLYIKCDLSREVPTCFAISGAIDPR